MINKVKTTAAFLRVVSCLALNGNHTAMKRSLVTQTMHIALREVEKEIKNCLTLHKRKRWNSWPNVGIDQEDDANDARLKQSAHARVQRYSPVDVDMRSLRTMTTKLRAFVNSPLRNIIGNTYTTTGLRHFGSSPLLMTCGVDELSVFQLEVSQVVLLTVIWVVRTSSARSWLPVEMSSGAPMLEAEV